MQANDLIYSSAGYHETVHAVTPEAAELITKYRASKFCSYMQHNGSVLEYGVGPGWNILGLNVKRRIGVDISSAYAAGLQATGIEFMSDLSGIADRSIDRIICSHVLEHLSDPASAVAEMRRVAKSSGLVILVVPLERALKTYSAKNPNHHLYSWNVQTFHNFLAACKLVVLSCEVKPSGYDRFAAELAVRFNGGMRLYNFLRSAARFVRPVHEIQAFCKL
ncbi:MAG TPA: class I SAM-dependent methyltransferase [Candidatus Angelobacter sp.]|jgi:ubiquinone/menaquinone biosynthesis C-methylase UbiE|nr:class I SAM-dependent methyltransferase [Candidatus Angelobacter sp.]